MKTYKLHSGNNNFFAFEIENAYIRLKKIAKLLNNILDVSDVKRRKLFSSTVDVHIQFKYQNKSFIVWEPYGDSSRYWIGPDDQEETEINISSIEKEFKRYKLPLSAKIFGDILTLNLRSLFKSNNST